MFPIRDNIRSRNQPIVVWLLVLVNGLVFFFELLMPQRELEQLFYLLGVVPARFTHPRWAESVGFSVGTYWPLFTSMFLHGGWMHIISNMWILLIFGDNVEDRMGALRFTLFYLLCGVISGWVHVITNANSTLPTVGASGAIAGVLGGYLILYPHAKVLTMIPVFIFPFFFEIPAVFFLVFWFFTQLLSGTASMFSLEPNVGGVAWWAHVGGFIAGMILMPLFLSPDRARRPPEAEEWHPEHARDAY